MININEPLATRMRPRSLSQVVGQTHLIGEDKILTRIAKSKAMTSIILYGPPGIGKTSIATALSNELNRKFEYFNASVHSKKELELITKFATLQNPVMIMIDEVHRLTKPNQDFLLMKLEEGSISIVGATTENPYMSITPALRSRSQILQLKPLSVEEIVCKLKEALTNESIGLGTYNSKIDDGVLETIAHLTNGDMRSALNSLELAVTSTEPNESGVFHVTKDVIATCLQSKKIEGDKDGDAHYNMLSAFQKSIRGSDVDASLHYLARLIEVGDLISINRRLLVIAYEDIGLANSALVAETLNAIESTEKVGFPEARIILSYITIRLALSKKSNVAYKAIKLASKALKTNRNSDIPNSLHDTHYKSAKKLGKGEGYKYSHDYPYGIVKQQFIPTDFLGDRYLQFRDDELPSIKESYEKINQILKE